jgi:hypothetical protein
LYRGRKDMNKYPLIGGSICAVVILVLASLANVVGYQTIQASNQKIITNELNEKDLLFQTICDITNNKEIQKVLLESQGNKFPLPFLKTPLTSFPVLTKKQLNSKYNLGVFLSKTMSKARIASLTKEHTLNVQLKEKINSIIKNDTKIREETTELSLFDCHCSETNDVWDFPIICAILGMIYLGLYYTSDYLLSFGFYTLYAHLIIITFLLLALSIFLFGISEIVNVFGETTFHCNFGYIPLS